MEKLKVEFSWDGEELGPKWMNEDNLKHLLFSNEYTKPELLSVKVTSWTEADKPEQIKKIKVEEGWSPAKIYATENHSHPQFQKVAEDAFNAALNKVINKNHNNNQRGSDGRAKRTGDMQMRE